MVNQTSEIDRLDVKKKLKHKSKIAELNLTIEELEDEHPPVKSKLEC